MERKIILTKDGSHTISAPDLNSTYHSLHGAIGESRHVFIEAGLQAAFQQTGQPLYILETGLGTGLNALLTLVEAEKLQRTVYYTAIELFPLPVDLVALLNYCEQIGRPDLQSVFENLHQCEWEKQIVISPYFTFLKSVTDLAVLPTLGDKPLFNLIYFDAFAPSVQPELWGQEIFEKMYSVAAPGSLLVTYCSKSIVRKAMQAAGFTIKKIQGPWGKREMVRASK